MVNLVDRTLPLSCLLDGIAEVSAADDRPVSGLALDSRQVTGGDAFIALPGGREHGIRHAAAAVTAGAVVVLADETVSVEAQVGAPVIVIPNLSAHLGAIASRLYGAPSERLVVWGVTGTNGKTSVSQFLAHLLNHLGLKCGVLGTLGYGFPGDLSPATHTTPDAIRVHRWLASFEQAGAKAAAMEVSSHALTQHRVDGVNFYGAIFTNLTRDHLDYHVTFEAYGEAKRQLFLRDELRYAVVNIDDPFGHQIAAGLEGRCDALRYSLHDRRAEIHVTDAVTSAQGVSGILHTPSGSAPFQSKLMGLFQLYNVMAAVAALSAMGHPVTKIAGAIARLNSVPGRMESFSARGLAVVVDYAHTPDALETALNALRPHCRGQLRVVFGCGGDRDRGKRPLMGGIAARLADDVMVTTDNPRSEVTADIISEILEGAAGAAHVQSEPDRATAIRTVVARAVEGDVVLVAGKGHEDYQEIQGHRYPYSDIALVRELMEEAA